MDSYNKLLKKFSEDQTFRDEYLDVFIDILAANRYNPELSAEDRSLNLFDTGNFGESPSKSKIKGVLSALYYVGVFEKVPTALELNKELQRLAIRGALPSDCRLAIQEFVREDESRLTRLRQGDEGVTNERSDPVSEENKLNETSLVPIFEGELNREMLSAALKEVMAAKGLTNRGAADLLGMPHNDIQRVKDCTATLDKSLKVLSGLGCKIRFECNFS